MIDKQHTSPVNAAAVMELRAETRLMNTRSCPTLSPVTVEEVARRNPGKQFSDLRGMLGADAEVVGLIFWRGNGRSIWALRCGCGRHEKVQHDWIEHARKRGFGWKCHTCKTIQDR